MFQHTPVGRCRIPSGLRTILTCGQVPQSWQTSDHTYLIFTIFFGILHCLVFISGCYNWYFIFPSLHFHDSCRRYGRFPLILIASVTTGLFLVLINKATTTADSFQALSCSLLFIVIVENTLVYCLFGKYLSLLSLQTTHFVNMNNSKSTPVIQEYVNFYSWKNNLLFLLYNVIILKAHPLGVLLVFQC